MPATTAHKILTVDDEQSIVDLIVDILENNNYIAISATRWTDAIDALTHEKPDLVLLDLKMPTIHGTSMLDFIIHEGFNVPVIVVSGFVTAEVAEELRQQGVQGIIHKPFKARLLLDEIEKILKQASDQPVDALNDFYAQAPAQAPEPADESHPTMDALYGSSEKASPSPAAPQKDDVPAADILQALQKANHQTQDTADAKPINAFPKAEVRRKNIPPAPSQSDIPLPSQNNTALQTNGPPPMTKPSDAFDMGSPLSQPVAQPQMSFGVDHREKPLHHHHRRRRMNSGSMMFMGAITIVCFLVAGVLAVMQYLASEAPTAIEKINAQVEGMVQDKVNQQVQQQLQQQQQLQLQQQINQAK